MRRKRPCRICRHWFVAHPRAGERQRVCSKPQCQKERHRRACAAWRKREQEGERVHRLRQRILEVPAVSAQAGGVRARLRWDAVRDAVGLEMAVIIEEMRREVEDLVRDAVRRQALENTGQSSREMKPMGRDDIALSALTP